MSIEVIVGLVLFAAVSFLWTQLPEEPQGAPAL